MKMKWKLFGLLLGCAMLLVMPQLALADETASLIVNGEDIIAAADHTVQCGEGTASYDPATKTLTLNNATINKGNIVYDRLIEAQGIDLNIDLVGENTLDGSAMPYSSGICVLGGNLNITGQADSRLDINVGDSNGITVKKSSIDDPSDEPYNLSINGVAVDVKSIGSAIYVSGSVEIKNGADVTVNAGDYGISGATGVVIDNAKVNAVGEKYCGINSAQAVEIKNKSVVDAKGMTPGITGMTGVIINGATVNAVSAASNGVFSGGNVAIGNGAGVTANGKNPGIYSDTGVIISGSVVKAESTDGNGICSNGILEIIENADVTVIAKGNYAAVYGHGGVSISGAKRVYVEAMNSHGIFSDGNVQIVNSKDVAVKCSYIGIRGYDGVSIAGSVVNATSSDDTGIYSPNSISITNNSNVTAEGLGAGIEVFGGNLHIGSSTVNAKSTAADEATGDNGITCNGGNIVIDGDSSIKAEGFFSGIYSSGNMSISGGKVEAVSTGDFGLCSGETLEIKNGAEIIARGDAGGISSNNGDVVISGATVSAVCTREQNVDEEKGTGIYSANNTNITNSVVNSESSYGFGILSAQVNIKGNSDITANGTDIGISCADKVEVNGSKVKAIGETGIKTGDNPEKGDLYIVGSWVETSSPTNEALLAVNSVLIEDGVGTVSGNAVLPNNVVIADGQTLTVSKSESLTIPNGKSLTLEQGGKLIIEDGGKVVKKGGTFTNNGGILEGTVTENKGGGAPAVQSYTLTFETNGGSSIKAVSKTASETVNLADYKPTKDGYEFDGWYADKELKNKITEIKLDGNKTVYAAWREAGTSNGSPFADIKNDQWFYDDVMFVYEKGLMNGASDNAFEPSGTATRGMLAAILWRQAGSPAAESAAAYKDVPAGRYYTDAIRWTTEQGVYTGFGEGVFRPDEEITREQLAAVLYRYAKFKGADVTKTGDIAGFADAGKVSAWAQEPLKWAVGNGIVNGQGNNTLNPQGMAQRADIAAMLHRFLDKF